MIKKMLVCMMVASMLVNTMAFADATKGDPKTNFHQVQNEGHQNASNWVVKSIGKNQQFTLYRDGSVTKTDTKEELEVLDLTDWIQGSQGNTPSDYRVNYISPYVGAIDTVVVSYNFETYVINGATRLTYDVGYTNFREVLYTNSQLTVPPYCAWGVCI